MSAGISSPEASLTPVAAPSFTAMARTSCPTADPAALPFDQRDKTLDQSARAAHGEVHAPLALEESDQAVDRRRGEGIAADQQRMKAQDHAQSRIANVPGDETVDRPITGQPDHVRNDPDHIHPRGERDIAEPLEADPEDRLARPHEPLVARDVRCRQPCDLGAHGGGIAGVVERLAVLETNAVERRHRPELDVIRQPPPAQPPELLEQKGSGDDGRTGVEREAVLTMDVGPASRRVELLENGNPIAPGSEPNRGSQAAKPAADDHGMRLTCVPAGFSQPPSKVGRQSSHTRCVT